MKKILTILFLLAPLFLFSEQSQEIEFNRSDFLKENKEKITLIYKWLSYTKEVAIHQMRGGEENRVFLAEDGHREAVFGADGELVKDGINDGSYNFAHPYKDPLGHFSSDIHPWIKWGSSDNDPTSIKERLQAYSIDLGGGLSVAQVNKKRKIKFKKLSNTELEVVSLFMRIIEEGGISEVYDILKDKKYVPENPYALGEGLTRALINYLYRNRTRQSS